MTENHTYALSSRVGRKKEFPIRITLPMSAEMLEAIDAAKLEGEDRLSLIRAAIQRELDARAEGKKKQ